LAARWVRQPLKERAMIEYWGKLRFYACRPMLNVQKNAYVNAFLLAFCLLDGKLIPFFG
jgi:hypothetical protein